MNCSCLRRATVFALGLLTIALILAGNTIARSAEPNTEKRAVIAANTAFYKAFREEDVEAMDGLWARSVEASVIHPGWNGIVGRGDVMRSWRNIIVSGGAPKVFPQRPVVTIHAGTATVLCYEKIDNAYLVATNIFVKEDGAWRLIHHHAGPAPTAGTLFEGDPA